MNEARFDRQLALFGVEGQSRLQAATVAVVGAGGTGSVVVPQLALLGVGHIIIIDHDAVEESNRNRHFCARHDDPIPGTAKVDIARRMVREYDQNIAVEVIPESLLSPAAFQAIRSADFVFGCVDLEGIRLVLLELCMAHGKPYFDIATGIEPGSPPIYGGRVCCSIAGSGCLVCLGELDAAEAARDLESPEQRRDREANYGVIKAALGARGPSVVSINAVMASLAVTEFMKLCTGLATPTRLLRYDGGRSRVSPSRDAPAADCYYCKGIAGAGVDAGTDRFISASSPPAAPSLDQGCARTREIKTVV